MGQLIVLAFSTLDGVVEDPDGHDGTTFGGWAMRHGPGPVAGDKFRLGPLLDTATLLFGRRTWQHFSTLWPTRDDPFSRSMNRAPKAVVTTRALDTTAWSNSRVITGEVEEWVASTLASTDLVVVGSIGLVGRLAAAGLVDEYRLITFPTAVGDGRRLFAQPARLQLVSSDAGEQTVLSVWRREAPAR
jgi:dihydrofolate reductase